MRSVSPVPIQDILPSTAGRSGRKIKLALSRASVAGVDPFWLLLKHDSFSSHAVPSDVRQNIPVTAMTEYVRDPQFVSEEWHQVRSIHTTLLWLLVVFVFRGHLLPALLRLAKKTRPKLRQAKTDPPFLPAADFSRLDRSNCSASRNSSESSPQVSSLFFCTAPINAFEASPGNYVPSPFVSFIFFVRLS